MRGFIDLREMADIIDHRASTLRRLLAEGTTLLPQPVYLLDSNVPYWPLAAVREWARQGHPVNFEYDRDGYTQIALTECGFETLQAPEIVTAGSHE